jgi:tetratricopeptide (TPR) repeat protein
MRAGEDTGRLARGATFGRYLILERLGEGSMGEVYAAYDSRLDRRVALKLPCPGSPRAATAEGHARLLREAQSMARLSHPNVVTIFDAGEIGGEIYLAMELVDGVTLRQWIAERRRSWRETLALFVQAGRGLVAAHAAGIVHRDFKPDNVMVDRQGRARVTDFGLARSWGAGRPSGVRAERGDRAPADEVPTELPARAEPLEAPALPAMTRTGAFFGTPAYMAPEQLDGKSSDARTDQFAFCVALHEALYGERPFAAETLEALAFVVSLGKVRAPPADARVPPWLRRALLKGLAPDPARRYPSMDALLGALGRDPARRARRWGMAALLGLVAVAGGAGIAALRSRADRACRADPDRLAGVWDGARRESARRAFLATGVTGAQDAWDGAGRALDAYAEGWLAAYQEACDATHRRGDQSALLLDLRTQCLDRRRQELRAAADLFASADAQVVQRAAQVAHAQSPLASCSSATVLGDRVQSPEQPSARRHAEELRARIARVKVLAAAGRCRDAVAAGETIAEGAGRSGPAAVQAEALLALAVALELAGQLDRAEAALHRAVDAALASHHDEALAGAAVALTRVVGSDLSRPEEGHRWSTWAQAAIAGLGEGHQELEADRLCNEGAVYRAQGRSAEARGLVERCLALRRRVLRDGDPKIAEALDSLGGAGEGVLTVRPAPAP